MPVGDIWQLSVDQTLFGQKLVNTFHYRQGIDEGSEDAAQQLMTAFKDDVIPVWTQAVTDDLNFVQLRAVRVHPGPTQPSVLAVGVPGVKLGTAASANVTAIGALYAEDVTKRGIGRNFYSGFPETDIQLGLLETGNHDDLNAILDKLIEILQAVASVIQFVLVIYSAIDTIGRIVTSGQARSPVRKLRSRTVGQGS